MSSTNDFLEDTDAARQWATLHGLEHWVLISPKGEWLIFCRRSDGVVFTVGKYRQQRLLLSLTVKPKHEFTPVDFYIDQWNKLRGGGWRMETK